MALITEEIGSEMLKLWGKGEEEKRKYIKFLRLKWHPDKNQSSDVAKKVFQYIETQKEKFLADPSGSVMW